MNSFTEIYKTVQKIPLGKVSTYGAIGRECGITDARVVGWALKKNPDNSKTPCHRVVNKKGEVSIAFAFGGANQQIFLLKEEGVNFISNGVVDLSKHLFMFNQENN